MILAFRRPCADHRAALFAFVDRREISASTSEALDHLETCHTCIRELAATSLTIIALRRMCREIALVEPSADAWVRLRSRITRRVDPWRWRATLGGLATSALLVAVLVLPVTIGAPATVGRGLELPENLAGLRRESEYLASIRAGSLPPAPRVEHVSGSIPRSYPPEIAQVRKEVTPTPPPLRPAEPI